MPVVMVGDRGGQHLQLETKSDGAFVLSLRDPLNEFELRIAFARHEIPIIYRELGRLVSRMTDQSAPPGPNRTVKIIRPDGDDDETGGDMANDTHVEQVHHGA